jgi:hypothetical protein
MATATKIMEQSNMTEKYEVSIASHNDVPWSFIDDGLNLICRCVNKECKLFEKDRIKVHKHFTEGIFGGIYVGFIDVQYHNTFCPLCNLRMYIHTFGFLNCEWKIQFGKINGTTTMTDWIATPKDKYVEFNRDNIKISDYRFINVYTRKLL